MSSSAPPSEALSSAKQKLFELMLERERASQRVASERIPRVDRSRPLPLSFAQQRLWFLDRLEPGSHAYNLPLIVRLRGDLDVAVLQRSLDELIRRHEVLRTRFGLRDGQPVQIVDAELHLPLRQIDLRQVDDTLDPEDIAAADNRLPYDLATGPLLRATLVRTDETDHLFILNVHHIVSDGWSLGVLVREIGGLYQAFAADQPVPFQELPIQYGDFAVWQREMLAGEVFGQQLDYWQRLLASAPAVLELPADNPRPPVQSISGRTLTFALPDSASTGVRALAHAEEATLFTALLTVFEVLLSRYSGQNDLLVGTPVANRNRVQLEGLIGFFVNTLVLRTEIADDPSFRGLLQQVRRSVVGALQHQDIPFERLVEELQPQRDVSRSPLFQVMFALQNKPDLDQEFAGVRLTPVEIDPQTSKFDLTLTLEETADGLLGKLEYPLALFDPSTADRMAKHFETLLLGVVEDPDRRLAELPLLASSERRQIEQWNATAVDYPRRQTVHGLFEARVAAHPERIALTFGQQALTYRELDRRAEGLAGMLEALGAGTERPIGVELERSAAMVVAVLAVLKTGAAFLPLDPTYPPERLAFMLADAEARIVITQQSLAGSLEAYDGRLVVFDGHAIAAEEEVSSVVARRESREPEAGNEHLAYLIYTSGSTGQPKGVPIHHRPVVNFLASMADRPGLDAGDALLAVTTLGFDIAGLELFLPLTVGARIALADRQAAADGEALAALLTTTRATAMQATPATWRLLLTAQPKLSRLAVLCGGEALDRDLADQLVTRAKSVWNLYGPTETTIWSAVDRVLPATGPVRVGHPIANTQVWLVDQLMQPVPVGIPGELAIGGDGLSRGYHRRPGLTAQCFVPDALDPRADGARIYRTGDLARWRSDGRIEFLGRLDHQVKVRGFRIELGEIEAALGRHPAVRQAVVGVCELTAADHRLAAYVIPQEHGDAQEHGDLSIETVREFLSQHLPEAFLPSFLVLLEALPLTPNGKVDRRALPQPEGARPELAVAYTAPRNEVEGVLVEIWQELLQVDEVGIEDNFFDLGGHSLLLVEAHARLREQLETDLSVIDLFQFPTIKALAAHLSGGDGGAARQAESEARARHRRQASRDDSGIAIIAQALRLPDAASPEAFWANLRDGVNSIRFFSPEHALAAGVAQERIDDSTYILSEASLGDSLKAFDAAFFGYSPREAELIDPQQRLFLEACWEALERAGHGGEAQRGRVGVFGSAAVSSYLQENLQGYAEDYDAMSVMSDYFLRVTLLSGNTNDFLSQRIAYHLGLNGPCINVQTACSSSVVAVHLACESLRNHECDMALAGGVQVRVPEKIGYQYLDGGLPSPDGQCRPFDARAQGTVHGNGLGVVVLKRLEDAIADGDPICSVIKGSAVNNDGADRVGFTAPSVEGQAKVVAEALAVAGTPAETIGFVEAHGTATDLGDPIEVRALTQAFRAYTEAKGFCALGSLKSNLGHLDTSAGIASLIKAVLAVQHGEVPPTVHFEKPNPKLDMENGPFFVNSTVEPWPTGEGSQPRRAAVNTFAIGGTNVNLVLEQAPARQPSGASRPCQLVVLSAKTSAALHAATTNLTAFLRRQPETSLADLAFTLSVGRRAFKFRRAVACRSVDELVTALESLDPSRVHSELAEQGSRGLTLVFPGQGEIGSLATLGDDEPVFLQHFERCADLLERLRPGLDLTALARDGSTSEDSAVVLFSLEYALAQLWVAWGCEPQAVAGVGVGELVAACVAGVLSLEDALKLLVGESTDTGEPIACAAPSVAILSAAAGDWLSPTEATDPDFWRSVMGTGDGHPGSEALLNKLVQEPERVLLEIGPEETLGPEIEDHPDFSFDQTVLSSVSQAQQPVLDQLFGQLGRLWARGDVAIDWTVVWGDEERRRLLLPTYPFERREYWIERRSAATAKDGDAATPEASPDPPGCCLVLVEDPDSQQPIVERLRQQDQEVFILTPGAEFKAFGGGWTLRPDAVDDYEALHTALIELGRRPSQVLCFWDPDHTTQIAVDGLALLTGASQATAVAGQTADRGSTPIEAALGTSRHERPDLVEEYVAPRNELERLVAEAWSEVLGIQDIGVHDEFYELGGNSLVATRLVARLRETLHVELSLRQLLELRSVAEVAEALDQGQFESPAAADIEDLLDELEELSSEDAERLVGAAEA